MSAIENHSATAYVSHGIPPFTSLGGMPLTPEREELIERARALVPRLRDRTSDTQRGRRLPDATIADLREAGLLDLRKPREYGGYELDNQTYADVVAELARGCASTAWTVAIINDVWFMAGTVLPAGARREFYESGLAGTAPFYPRKGAVGRKVDGGYMIDYGEWPWASGSQLAGWAFPRVNLLDDDGTPLDVLVPMISMDDVEVLDEWHTMAMRGSASNTLKVENLFVPDDRVGRMSRILTGEHLAEVPDFQRQPWLTGVIVGVIPIAIGLGRAAVELFLERISGRPIATTTYGDGATAARMHLLIAEAAKKIDAADLLVHRAAAMLDLAAARGVLPSLAERVKTRGDFAYAAELSIDAVEMLFRNAGASAIAQDSPLAVIALDSHAIPMHSAFNTTTGLENYGAVLLGQAPPAMQMGDFVAV